MCNDSQTKLEETDDGNILITINPYDVWELLSLENKEQIIRDRGMWHIIEREMEYELPNGVSGDSFMPSLQRFREKLATDPELVSDTVIACIKQLLEDKAEAIQKEREAGRAFWKLYHRVKEHFESRDRYSDWPEWAKKVQTNYDINKEDDYMQVSTKDVKEEVLKAFSETLI